MRRKFLAILASFFVLSLAITSCLDSDNERELSSDNLITAFELEPIYGVNYKFTIDQLGGRIFNQDSVPFSADTIINRILIKTLSTGGYVTAGETAEKDTFFNYTDSVDFSNTMENQKPLVLRIRPEDGSDYKQYKISVNIHQVDPDTLVWGNNPEVADDAYIKQFTGDAWLKNVNVESKAVWHEKDNELFVFASDGTTFKAYKGASKSQFQEVNITTPPAGNVNASSVIYFKEKLYAIAGKKAYHSTDGEVWVEITTSYPVIRLLTTFNNTISGIIESDGKEIFAAATINPDGSMAWEKGADVPDNFPTENLSATKSYTTATGGQQALLIGKPTQADAKATYPWFSDDGLRWAELPPTHEKYALPAMDKPTVLYYGKTLYAFGKNQADGFSYIYTSLNGIAWEKIKKKFMLPMKSDGTSVFKDRAGNYTVTVDQNNYIWMFWNQEDEAWRGKLNRLGFKIQ